MEDGNFSEAGSVKRPLSMRIHFWGNTLALTFELYGREHASLRLNSKLYKTIPSYLI
jgi:hypothetical protein